MTDSVKQALEDLTNEAMQYIGCICDRGDCEAGDCWPCRMMSIIDLVDDTRKALTPQADNSEALEAFSKFMHDEKHSEAGTYDSFEKLCEHEEEIKTALTSQQVGDKQPITKEEARKAMDLIGNSPCIDRGHAPPVLDIELLSIEEAEIIMKALEYFAKESSDE